MLMKKFTILFILSFTFHTFYAQIVPDSDSLGVDFVLDSEKFEEIIKNYISNNTSNDTLIWRRVNNKLPEGWVSAACTEATCFFPETETGIMVEMKCPYKRKCTNDVPEQYFLQIQGQLATCNLSHCDYVECYFETYNDMSEYDMMCKDMNTTNHGIIIEFMNESENYVYEYSPEWLTSSQCIKWANNEVAVFIKNNPSHTFVKITPFKLKNMFHTRVEFNKTLWDELVPLIYEFWKDVEELRKNGSTEVPKVPRVPSISKRTLNIEEVSKYKFIDDSDDETK